MLASRGINAARQKWWGGWSIGFVGLRSGGGSVGGEEFVAVFGEGLDDELAQPALGGVALFLGVPDEVDGGLKHGDRAGAGGEGEGADDLLGEAFRDDGDEGGVLQHLG